MQSKMALFLMCGTRSAAIGREHYDCDGRLLSREIERGYLRSRGMRGISCPGNGFGLSPRGSNPRLIEGIRAAFGKRLPVRPILFHFFSSQIHMPELAMLFLGTAREAMLPDLGNESTTLFSTEEYRKRIEPARMLLTCAGASQTFLQRSLKRS